MVGRKDINGLPRDCWGGFLFRSGFFGFGPWTKFVSGWDYLIFPDGRFKQLGRW
jgi:hypothetical protein